MWNPNLITVKTGQLEFTSSGQSLVDVTQIYFDDWLFCNGVELLEIDNSSIQFIVCMYCGYSRCEPGNWLAVRRGGEFVFLIPAFFDLEEGDWELSEYYPPYKVQKFGGIYLSKAQYTELCSLIPSLFAFENITNISEREVALLIQWEAPYQALGEFPAEVKFKQALYLATESSLEQGIIKKLFSLLNGFLSSNKAAELVEISELNTTIFLDTNEYTQWNPISEVEGHLYLRLEPIFGFKT